MSCISGLTVCLIVECFIFNYFDAFSNIFGYHYFFLLEKEKFSAPVREFFYTSNIKNIKNKKYTYDTYYKNM